MRGPYRDTIGADRNGKLFACRQSLRTGRFYARRLPESEIDAYGAHRVLWALPAWRWTRRMP